MLPALRQYQGTACDGTRHHVQAGKRRVCLVSPTGCHSGDELVMMADGAARRVVDVEVNDLVMGVGGEPRRVLQLCRGSSEMFTVHPTKGRPFSVNIDHVLSLVRTREGSESWKDRGGEIVDITVREWLKWNKYNRHLHKLFRSHVASFQIGTGQCVLPPWILGALLGDGCLRASTEICTADPEIVDGFRLFCESVGLALAPGAISGASRTYRLSGGRGRHPESGCYLRDTNPVTAELRRLGLILGSGEKFVPPSYKFASSVERLELLAGLIDTDGSLGVGGYDYISKSRRLSEDVAFIARSLGLAAYVTQRTKSAHADHVGTYYRVSISGACNVIPCRVKRKRSPVRAQKKSVLRTGMEIESAGSGEFFGFTLDGDGRYLLDDFTVTHNSGKTRMGVELALSFAGRGLWLAHRTELIEQAAVRLREAGLQVGMISPEYEPDPWAQVQVASLDTLVARGVRPAADWVIHDECHHAMAETYDAVLESYRSKILVGLTATPQRRDGRALSHRFDALVVAATYSELLRLGHITPCRVFRPDEYMGSDLARSPLEAYRDVSVLLQGHPLTFAFAQTVELAQKYALDFSDSGIPSAALTAKTSDDERKEILDRFRAGNIRVLWNVYVLTEGVDIPQARVCLLARGVSHAGPFIQMCGRVLRPHEGKTDSVLLDLSGASHLHGFPTADRDYALDGRPITVVGEPLKNCPKCGATIPAAENPCASCGWVFQVRERRGPKIWDLELREAVEAVGGDAAGVSEVFKRREWDRLIGLCREKGWSPAWAERQYRELFGVGPKWMAELPADEKQAEYRRLRAKAVEKGYSAGWAAYRYKAAFGAWPPRSWV